MVRTNVVVDETLVQEVKRRFGLKSKREAIDFALHAVLSDDDDAEIITDPWKAALELGACGRT